jgi:hypothetical protein
VFASDVGALRERIRRHGGGWLADHTDPRRWYAMMLTVLDNPREYEEQSGRIARMKVESVATMAARYHQIYDRLLHPPATPAQSTGARLLAAEAPSAD